MDSVDGTISSFRNTGLALVFQQFYALIMKKLLYSWRNPFLTLSQFLLPVLFTVSAILIMRTNPLPSDSSALDLSLNTFKSTKTSYFVHSNDYKDLNLSQHYQQLSDGDNSFEANLYEDIRVNLTASAMEYLVNESSDISSYSLHRPIGAIFDSDEQKTNQTRVTTLFNNQAYHSPAISLRYVDNAIIRHVLNKSDFKLDVINHPMPRTTDEQLMSARYQNQAQFQYAQSIMFAMSFLSASFVVLLVRERSIKGKHLQMVCGVKLYIFWITSYIIDFLTYIIPCGFILLIYYLFDEPALSKSAQEARLFLLFVLHGCAMLPFVYLLSFLFDIPSTAYVRICLYNVILGIGTFLAVIITELPALKIQNVSKILNDVFSIFLPNFVLGRSVYNLYNNYIGNDICNSVQQVTIKEQPPPYVNQWCKKLPTNRSEWHCEFTISKFCQYLDEPIIPEQYRSMLEPIRMCCRGNCYQCSE